MIPASTGALPAAGAEDTPTCYLLHFDQPYKHARHYLGSTADLSARLDAHRRGRGARLTEVITEAGIGFQLVRTWPGGRARERALKDLHHGPKLCPVCTPHPLPTRSGRVAGQPAAAADSAGISGAAMPATRRPQADPYERGVQMAGQFLARQAGRDAGQIAATHSYITRPWHETATHTETQTEIWHGYKETVEQHLAQLRESEREAEAEAEAGQ